MNKFKIEYSDYMLDTFKRVAEENHVKPEDLQAAYEEVMLSNFDQDVWDIMELNRDRLEELA